MHHALLARAVLALTLLALFGVHDRFAGGDFVTVLRNHVLVWAGREPVLIDAPVTWLAKARSTLWAGVSLALCLIPVSLIWRQDARIVALALAWTLWRLPGWGVIPGASIDPGKPLEIAATFGRHLFGLAAVPILVWLGAPWAAAVVLRGIFAALATLLAWLEYRFHVAGKDINAPVEICRGGLDGLTDGLAIVCGA